jgi:hypothetical protein
MSAEIFVDWYKQKYGVYLSEGSLATFYKGYRHSSHPTIAEFNSYMQGNLLPPKSIRVINKRKEPIVS